MSDKWIFLPAIADVDAPTATKLSEEGVDLTPYLGFRYDPRLVEVECVVDLPPGTVVPVLDYDGNQIATATLGEVIPDRGTQLASFHIP